jgi:general transcription factor IIIA
MLVHQEVNHEGKRDFVCPHDECQKAFGYRHLLKRHLLSRHEQDSDGAETEVSQPESHRTEVDHMDIDTITGFAYASHAQLRVRENRALLCPYPNLTGLQLQLPLEAESGLPCQFVFSRGYDMWRHLRAVHKVEIPRAIVDDWVRERRSR